ncbi:MAG: right-handed parallel beta-helix repeat-containing protein [Bacteroidota bacterium]
MKRITMLLLATTCAFSISAKEYHVSKAGDDQNPGSVDAPFLTIMAAACVAQAGDVITVHEGCYRERITPPRGGESDSRRITYQAAKGKKIEIKGSELIKEWKRFKGDVWKVTLHNSFFGNYNPYTDTLQGDWYTGKGRTHHTGEVYLNGKSLYEVGSLEDVLNPEPLKDALDPEGSTYTWYCETDEENTTLYANFHGAKPNRELVEINARPACFYPARTGINYITISGFRMSQAATQWAPPTAEQIGLIGTFWSKGWIIENNVISDSKCTGITLGKDRESGHNAWSGGEQSKGGASVYIEVVIKALELGWSKENIGSHIVRKNTIFNCEQAGICGSLGGAFSTITGNHIYNIYRKRQFSGWEKGAIKLHAPIDVVISDNCLHDAQRAMWLDWMTQGTRITSNVCYNNDQGDLCLEVNHGPYLFDNNIFLSGIENASQGGAFIHNILAGEMVLLPIPGRFTPYHIPHSTNLMGLALIQCGDDRIYNNIHIATDYKMDPGLVRKHNGFGMVGYNTLERKLPIYADNNLYYNGAEAYRDEPGSATVDNFDPEIEIIEEGDNIYLQVTFDKSVSEIDTKMITSAILGTTVMTRSGFENRDGTDLVIDRDYFGNKRDPENPTVGPFKSVEPGIMKIKVWPKNGTVAIQ